MGSGLTSLAGLQEQAHYGFGQRREWKDSAPSTGCAEIAHPLFEIGFVFGKQKKSFYFGKTHLQTHLRIRKAWLFDTTGSWL